MISPLGEWAFVMTKNMPKLRRRSAGDQARAKFRGRRRKPQTIHARSEDDEGDGIRRYPGLAVAMTPEGLASTGQDLSSFLKQDVDQVLQVRGVPLDRVHPPRSDILLRAADAMRCSIEKFRPHYARLVASAMDAVESIHVHPAWIEMLKQLTEDEIAMLIAFPPPGRVVITADLVMVLRSQELMVAYRHIIPAKLAAVCEHKSNIPMYLDNLLRLNLVHRPATQQVDRTAYQSFLNLPFVEQLRGAAPRTSRVTLDQSVISITNLGEHFRRSCLLD